MRQFTPDTGDARRIKVAFIYDDTLLHVPLPVDESVLFHVVMRRHASREIVRVNFETTTVAARTWAVLGNHWPSRSGGQFESEGYRAIARETLGSEIIRCLKRYVAREIFNALPILVAENHSAHHLPDHRSIDRLASVDVAQHGARNLGRLRNAFRPIGPECSRCFVGTASDRADLGAQLEASMRRHLGWLPTYRSTSTSITQAPARPVSNAMTTAGAIQYSPPPRSAISVAPPSTVRTATATLGT
jgi:hypothetical protein